MTPEQRERLRALARRIKGDFPWYARRFLRIKTKDAKIESLVLKSVQKKIDAHWQKAESEARPLRLYVLKARREGVSTHTDGRIFHRTATRSNRSALIVAHLDDTAVGLFDMVRLFQDSLPPPLRPMERYSSRRELVFENPHAGERPDKPGLRSRISVASARNVDTGKGTLVHDLHCSEFAFYSKPREFLDSIIPTVPDLPGTAIVLETTPDAIGSYAHELWEASKRGETQFTPVFLAWFDDDTYRIPFASDNDRQAFLATLSDDEATSQDAYGLDPEQLHWRREEMKKYSSREAFLNQHPENDFDCWLTAGAAALPTDALLQMKKACTPPKARGRLETYLDEKDPKNPVEKIRFTPDPKGPLSVWRFPAAEGQYVVGADTSEGLPGRDSSAADVVDKETSEQVAQWHGIIDPDLFGEQLALLGWFYRSAEIGVERNNHGLTTIVALKNAGYSNLFRSVQVDERTNKTMNKLGWLTTRATKPIMIDELRQRIRERSVTINASETIDECLTYIRLPDGSTGAQENCHDDRVMSLAVALQVLNHNPYAKPRRMRVSKESAPVYGPV